MTALEGGLPCPLADSESPRSPLPPESPHPPLVYRPLTLCWQDPLPPSHCTLTLSLSLVRARAWGMSAVVVGALVVYDITKDTTFENVEKWLAELKENATADITMMLVGNKTDLANARVVSTEQGKAYAAERGITFLEASALTASNVEASFLQILSEIYHKKRSKEQEAGGAGGGGGSGSVSVDIRGAKPKGGKCC
jgi:hypothetical protein